MSREQSVRNAVADAVEQTALRQDVPIRDDVVGQITPQITNAIMRTPEMQFVTNTEPTLQSFGVVGALIAIIPSAYGLVLDFGDGTLPTVGELTLQITPIVGGLSVLWGRFFANRGIGA